MSEFISSATVLCSAPEPQQFVLHFLSLSGILWSSLPGEIDSNSLLAQITRHQQISKPIYLSKPGRGKGTAQRLINSSFCFLLMEAFPWEFLMLIMGDRLSHQEGILSLKCQSRLNLLCSNAEDFICKPSLVFPKWPPLENTFYAIFSTVQTKVHPAQDTGNGFTQPLQISLVTAITYWRQG